MEKNHKNPRKLLNSWEAQALATLTSKGLPNSFKAVSEIIHDETKDEDCLLYTSPSPRDAHESRMPSSA